MNQINIANIEWLVLDSVGCWLHNPTGMTYPITADGGIDTSFEMAVHICEVDSDWINSLDEEDRETLNQTGLIEFFQLA